MTTRTTTTTTTTKKKLMTFVTPVRLKSLNTMYVELDPRVCGDIIRENVPMELIVDEQGRTVTLKEILQQQP
jgi:hypothetical protein